MKTYDAVVIGLEHSPSKKLQKLNGQTVTVLCGNRFRDGDTNTVLKIDDILETLVITDNAEYLVLKANNIYTDPYEEDNFVHKLRTAPPAGSPGAYRFNSIGASQVRPDDQFVRDLYGNPASKRATKYERMAVKKAAEDRLFTDAVNSLPSDENMQNTM